jgi:hypothetical protein
MEIHIEIFGDGSHSHQDTDVQGMGSASFIYIRTVDTARIYTNDTGLPYEPVEVTMGEHYEEFRMSHTSVCTPACPEFMAIILPLYQGYRMIKKTQEQWNISPSNVKITVASDSQNIVNYINGPVTDHPMQVPWLAIPMGMTRSILNIYDNEQWTYSIKYLSRADPTMEVCNKHAIHHRRHHLPSFNVDPWIQHEINIAMVVCARIKERLNEDRFHATKKGILHTNWSYIPQYNTVPSEELVFNTMPSFNSFHEETFAHWYRRHRT